MIVVKNIEELKKILVELKEETPNKKIGFVPTMGALHKGHLSLIDKALQHSNYVLCSIFVNPTQFNNLKDLEKYPRTIEDDIQLLKSQGCDLLYLPSEKEIYPDKNKTYKIEFGDLDKIMEGKFRPGHFKGVAMVVERFFDLISPDIAFFGQKDFQQVAIIRKMVEKRKMDVEIRDCPTQRSSTGLALSSRNSRLSEKELEDALIIYQTLEFGIKNRQIGMDTSEFADKMKSFFSNGKLELEYLEIVNDKLETPETLSEGCTCCIAAYCGSVRLIDNMIIT